MIRNIHRILLPMVAVLVILLGACGKDSLEPRTEKQLDLDDLKSVELLRSLMDGAYKHMANDAYYGMTMMPLGEVRADNCLANQSTLAFADINAGNIVSDDSRLQFLWENIYRTISNANAVIARESATLEGDAAEQKHIVGEAYGIRALAHFDLLRLFGAEHVTGADAGIPYVSSYPVKDPTPPRTPVAQIKEKLYSDLQAAARLMAPEQATKDKMNYYAAHHLLARVALWFNDYNTALKSLDEVDKGSFTIMPKDQYVESWRKKLNPNSIFELSITAVSSNTFSSISEIYNGALFGDVAATREVSQIFDAGDVRGTTAMIDINQGLQMTKGHLLWFLANVGKYPDHVNHLDNLVLMRYEESVLMRAEALYRLNRNAEALNVLNTITSERGAAPHAAIDEDVILLERRRELCFEGFRFDDLARFHRDVPKCFTPMGILKANPKYGDKLMALPIPLMELQANASLKQNPGY